MTEAQQKAFLYIFQHGGMPPPNADRETIQAALKAWKGCCCGRCDTPCKYENSLERFPNFVPGGRGRCLGLIRAIGEPFSWIDPLTREPAFIPARIVALIGQALKGGAHGKKQRPQISAER